jgi:hypothetical protein
MIELEAPVTGTYRLSGLGPRILLLSDLWVGGAVALDYDDLFTIGKGHSIDIKTIFPLPLKKQQFFPCHGTSLCTGTPQGPILPNIYPFCIFMYPFLSLI